MIYSFNTNKTSQAAEKLNEEFNQADCIGEC